MGKGGDAKEVGGGARLRRGEGLSGAWPVQSIGIVGSRGTQKVI